MMFVLSVLSAAAAAAAAAVGGRPVLKSIDSSASVTKLFAARLARSAACHVSIAV